MRPDEVMGTIALSALPVTAVKVDNWLLIYTLLFTRSKLLPETVTAAPATAEGGEKLATIGAAGVPTVKIALVVIVPLGAVTFIGPVVAVVGTVTVIWLAVTVVGVAATPLNDTKVFVLVPKPVPEIVTIAPEGPRVGVNCITTSAVMG